MAVYAEDEGKSEIDNTAEPTDEASDDGTTDSTEPATNEPATEDDGTTDSTEQATEPTESSEPATVSRRKWYSMQNTLLSLNDLAIAF